LLTVVFTVVIIHFSTLYAQKMFANHHLPIEKHYN
jgi:hypothetical protein